MFTLGREREKQHSKGYLESPDEASRIAAVIDAVHDVIEGVKRSEEAAPVFVEAFTKGGGGVWEQTGSWLRKLSATHADLGTLWREFCNHRSAKVRFRAAAFLDDMPSEIFAECFPALLADVSTRVRSKAASDRYQDTSPKVRDALVARLAVETDESVKEAINFALTYERP
jgi:hypothetical protein